MAGLNDGEIKKAFAEGQTKLFDFQRQMNTVKAQLQQKAKDKKIAEVTIRELEGFGEDTKVYRTVGKAFISDGMQDVIADLRNAISSAAEDEKSLETKEKWLERTLQETSSSLKDMLERRGP